MYFYQKAKKFLQCFFLIDDTPHKIAGGAAIGIFMGIIPGGAITALILASIFRLNRLSAGISALAFSFWTTLAVLPLAAGIGGFLFGISAQDLIADFNRVHQLGFSYIISRQFVPVAIGLAAPLTVGLIIIGGIISIAFYFLLLYLLKKEKLKFK